MRYGAPRGRRLSYACSGRRGGLHGTTDNYRASQIGRRCADDLHTPPRPMGHAVARRARLMRYSTEPARVGGRRGFQQRGSAVLGRDGRSLPPRDVALPRELTLVSWRRALASNVLMRHARRVQQVYQGQRPEVLPNLPIFSSHRGGKDKIPVGTLSS